LTEREWDLVRLLACGETLKQASATLHITYKAADNLKTNITRKLDIHDRVELARFAMREGIVCPTGPDDRVLRKINSSAMSEALHPILTENHLSEQIGAGTG
jgi:DNA-binding CsgD family transcriptional regulator